MLAVAASAHASAALPGEEVTLSRGLGTPLLPETRAPVGYCWQNNRCCQSSPETAAQPHRRPRVAPRIIRWDGPTLVPRIGVRSRLCFL